MLLRAAGALTGSGPSPRPTISSFFPDYVARRTHLPAEWFWRFIAWFHAPASAVLVSTPTIERSLHAHGIRHTRHWGRGVDLSCFTSEGPVNARIAALPRPVQLYVGRVAVEKNIEAFLDSRASGGKVVVGGGPALAGLQRKYPDAHFPEPLHGEALASAYRAADVFVFPSRTDTFGLVMVEAMACGVPVSAYPVPGPVDVLRDDVGAMDEDLSCAVAAALRCDRTICAEYGRGFSWDESARQFLAALCPVTGAAAM